MQSLLVSFSAHTGLGPASKEEEGSQSSVFATGAQDLLITQPLVSLSQGICTLHFLPLFYPLEINMGHRETGNKGQDHLSKANQRPAHSASGAESSSLSATQSCFLPCSPFAHPSWAAESRARSSLLSPHSQNKVHAQLVLAKVMGK